MTAACHPRLGYFRLVRPRHGYREGGDATAVVAHEGRLVAAIVDVLGHGPEAHEVAVRAEAVILEDRTRSDGPCQFLVDLHDALRGTRGAAAGVAVIEAATGLLRYAGVGNTVIRRFGGHVDRLVPVDGIVGGNMPTPREKRMVLCPGDTVVLHTDGVRDHFDLRDYPQLPVHDPETVARTLIRRFAKDYDDASCIVLRFSP